VKVKIRRDQPDQTIFTGRNIELYDDSGAPLDMSDVVEVRLAPMRVDSIVNVQVEFVVSEIGMVDDADE